ncbi:uncharacterized RNA-binding protein C1827.05c-like isoform X1 [Musa acuminata AAA Group]|uniref:uncharacterized RNA-binding protein C1827.05c-like isoform X1 n=1 Tax=Musa acuminata AAA Group TaxID=214697 RepID=UPI0031DBF07A
MGRINITRTRSPSVHTPLYQKLKVLKPLRLCVTPSTVTGGCLSATSSFDCEQGETTVKPLEGGPGRKITQEEDEPVKNTATVLYIGHIPHGFYEEQMEGFFKQFGKIKHLRIACNRKTGKSKHYGFIEFENPEVAKVVADEIHNYLLFEHNLQIHLIPPEHVHPKLWRGVNWRYNPLNWTKIARKQHNKERTVEEHQRMIKGILKRDEKRRNRIKAAGVEYECPDLVGLIQHAAKKIKFDEED